MTVHIAQKTYMHKYARNHKCDDRKRQRSCVADQHDRLVFCKGRDRKKNGQTYPAHENTVMDPTASSRPAADEISEITLLFSNILFLPID